jgi:abortive infection bacteriophage resistance protein
MSFSDLSRWYASLNSPSVKPAIAKSFNLPSRENPLNSWLKHLSTVRNCCAHYLRFWNEDTPTGLKSFRRSHHWLKDEFFSTKDSLPGTTYNTLVIMLYLMHQINVSDQSDKEDFAEPWGSQVKNLLETSFQSLEKVGLPRNWLENEMGFPKSWKEKKIWNL